MEEDPVEGEGTANQDPRFLKPDLYEAAKINDTDSVLKLLADQVPPTFIDNNNGWTALHWAAKNGNMPMLKKLIECGASAPYHRMLKLAKQKGEKSNASNGLLDSSDGRKNSDELAQSADDNGENQSYETLDNGSAVNENDSLDRSTKIGNPRLQNNSTEGDDEEDMEFFLETSSNLLQNTPLQWATVKGHLRAVWLLLLDGYSANDRDHLGNNSLHLAAVNGHLQILKVLVEDGGHANVVNIYKNLPIDMATDKDIREVLAGAMDRGASMTAHDIALKHEQNMIMYTMHVDNLNAAVLEAVRTDALLASKVVTNIPDIARRLSDAINDATEWALEETVIQKAETLLAKLEMTQDLFNDTSALIQCLPIRSQSTYVQNVHKLERTICRAEALEVDKAQLQASRVLIQRCQMECFLSALINRLKHVTCASDPNEHDMMKLQHNVSKAAKAGAAPEVVAEADSLFKRLEAELGMSRAILSVPTVRLPLESPPEGYWQECDTGKIEETEEYPLPPADSGGEYRWLHSQTYVLLKASVEKLKKCYVGADLLGANPTVIAAAKEKLQKSERQFKILDLKDIADKALAIEAVAKLVKKKKGGKKIKKV